VWVYEDVILLDPGVIPDAVFDPHSIVRCVGDANGKSCGCFLCYRVKGVGRVLLTFKFTLVFFMCKHSMLRINSLFILFRHSPPPPPLVSLFPPFPIGPFFVQL
jgi:hypothetical protein